MPLTDFQIRALLGALSQTREVEIDCDAFLAQSAALAEIAQRGEPLPNSLAAAAAHLALCANCREEWRALLTALAD